MPSILSITGLHAPFGPAIEPEGPDPGGPTVGATPDAAPGFLIALKMALLNDIPLTQLIGRRFWYVYRPQTDAEMPYILADVITDGADSYIFGAQYSRIYMLQFRIFAEDAEDSEAVGSALDDILSPERLNISWVRNGVRGNVGMADRQGGPTMELPDADETGFRFLQKVIRYDFTIAGRP